MLLRFDTLDWTNFFMDDTQTTPSLITKQILNMESCTSLLSSRQFERFFPIPVWWYRWLCPKVILWTPCIIFSQIHICHCENLGTLLNSFTSVYIFLYGCVGWNHISIGYIFEYLNRLWFNQTFYSPIAFGGFEDRPSGLEVGGPLYFEKLIRNLDHFFREDDLPYQESNKRSNFNRKARGVNRESLK